MIPWFEGAASNFLEASLLPDTDIKLFIFTSGLNYYAYFCAKCNTVACDCLNNFFRYNLDSSSINFFHNEIVRPPYPRALYVPISRELKYGVLVGIMNPNKEQRDATLGWDNLPGDICSVGLLRVELPGWTTFQAGSPATHIYVNEGVHGIRVAILDTMITLGESNNTTTKKGKCSDKTHGPSEEIALRAHLRVKGIPAIIEKYNLFIYGHCISCNSKYNFDDYVPDDPAVNNFASYQGNLGAALPIIGGAKQTTVTSTHKLSGAPLGGYLPSNAS